MVGTEEPHSHGPDEHKPGLTKRDEPRRSQKTHAGCHHDVDTHHDDNVEVKGAGYEGNRS